MNRDETARKVDVRKYRVRYLDGDGVVETKKVKAEGYVLSDLGLFQDVTFFRDGSLVFLVDRARLISITRIAKVAA